MMKTTLVLLSVAVCAVLAADEGATIKHRSADGKTHVVKFTTTPIGNQCAYDETKDPSLYPCKDRGVCVRLNSTYGKCFTEEEATQIQTQLDSSDGSEDSESGSGSEEDDSESASGSGSVDIEFEDAEVGSDQSDEIDDEEGDEEEEEEEVIIIRTDPPAH